MEDFLEKFWGDIKKNAVRHRLADGFHDAKKGTSINAHTYWELAKELRCTETSMGVVNEIMRHFPKVTQLLWFSLEAGNEIMAAEFLRKMDNMPSPPEECHPRKREGEEHKKNYKYREWFHAIKRRIHALRV